MTNPSQISSQANNPFAQTEADAEDRFKIYRSLDPFFDDIEPALLNSAHIYDYVAATGMIWPFDPEKLKSASYEVRLLGECVYWDEEGQKVVQNIKEGDQFFLKPNSIAFVTLEPMFRIPDYIALRFNLKIKNVYRGLLLGTGPLIDPGFVGRLSLPLHNLTTNEYEFKGGDGLIWMEFTKLSCDNKWKQSGGQSGVIDRQGEYKEFRNPPSDVHGYLIKADSSRSIRSSIPNEIRNAKLSAEKAAQSADDAAQSAKNAVGRITQFANEADKKLSQSQQRFALGSIAAVVLSIIAIVVSSWGLAGLFLSTSEYLNNTREKNLDHTQRIQSLEKQIQELNKRLDELENSKQGKAQNPATPKVSSTATP